jgi:hypothetical protein
MRRQLSYATSNQQARALLYASTIAVATGAMAIGVIAIAALAIGRLAVKKAKFDQLEIGELKIRRIRIVDGRESFRGPVGRSDDKPVTGD